MAININEKKEWKDFLAESSYEEKGIARNAIGLKELLAPPCFKRKDFDRWNPIEFSRIKPIDEPVSSELAALSVEFKDWDEKLEEVFRAVRNDIRSETGRLLEEYTLLFATPKIKGSITKGKLRWRGIYIVSNTDNSVAVFQRGMQISPWLSTVPGNRLLDQQYVVSVVSVTIDEDCKTNFTMSQNSFEGEKNKQK